MSARAAGEGSEIEQEREAVRFVTEAERDAADRRVRRARNLALVGAVVAGALGSVAFLVAGGGDCAWMTPESVRTTCDLWLRASRVGVYVLIVLAGVQLVLAARLDRRITSLYAHPVATGS